MRPESTSAVVSAARSASAATSRVKRRTPPVTSASSVCGTAITSHKEGPRGAAAQRYVVPEMSVVPSPFDGSNAAAFASGEPSRATQRPRAVSRSATSAPMRSESSPSMVASSRKPPRTTTGVPAQVPGRVATTARRSAAP